MALLNLIICCSCCCLCAVCVSSKGNKHIFDVCVVCFIGILPDDQFQLCGLIAGWHRTTKNVRWLISCSLHQEYCDFKLISNQIVFLMILAESQSFAKKTLVKTEPNDLIDIYT